MSLKKLIAAVMTAGVMMSFIPMTSMADSTGWYQDVPGWRYYTVEEGYIFNAWKKIGGIWYYFNDYGYMVAGADNYRIEDKYYDFSSSGECLNPSGKTKLSTGWNKVSYTGYGDNGRPWIPAVYNYWVYVGSDGELYKGWHSIGGKWYYFNKYSGSMYSGIEGREPSLINSCRYYFKPGSGEMLTGWIQSGSNWYYAAPSGRLYENEWLYSGGKWYYFAYLGLMIYNAVNYEINGVYYSFDLNGACINPSGTTDLGTGWVKRSHSYNSYSWHYIDELGNYPSSWNKIDGSWYYFGYQGSASQGAEYIGENEYMFNDNCQMITGWFIDKFDGRNYWQYAGSDGVVYKSKWLNQGGKWYYFDPNGMMTSDAENVLIDGKYYSFDSNGVCMNPSGVSEKITGWFKVCSSYGYEGYDVEPHWIRSWTYFDSNGAMYKDKWLNYAGKWYYFDKNGIMASKANFYIESEVNVYDFDKNGMCMNPNNPRVPKLS